eukprot:10815945-Alexandrium_andersonii.AAC.1
MDKQLLFPKKEFNQFAIPRKHAAPRTGEVVEPLVGRQAGPLDHGDIHPVWGKERNAARMLSCSTAPSS